MSIYLDPGGCERGVVGARLDERVDVGREVGKSRVEHVRNLKKGTGLDIHIHTHTWVNPRLTHYG